MLKLFKIWSNWLILSTKIKYWPLSLWINLITVWGVESFHRSEGKVFLFFSPCLLSYAANCSSHYPSTVSPFSVIEILVATSYHAPDLPSLQSCLKTNIWIRHVFRSVIARYLRCCILSTQTPVVISPRATRYLGNSRYLEGVGLVSLVTN